MAGGRAPAGIRRRSRELGLLGTTRPAPVGVSGELEWEGCHRSSDDLEAGAWSAPPCSSAAPRSSRGRPVLPEVARDRGLPRRSVRVLRRVDRGLRDPVRFGRCVASRRQRRALDGTRRPDRTDSTGSPRSKLRPRSGHAPDRDQGTRKDPASAEYAGRGAVVEVGTSATTHHPHRLGGVRAGRSRSQPVRTSTKCLLQQVIPGRSRL
jgi:hypothetical protein